MREQIFKKLTLFAFIASLGMTLSASMPPVTPTTLPATASSTNPYVFIDMDGDNDVDFAVDYNYYTGSGSYTDYYIYHWYSSGSILGEGIAPGSPAPQSLKSAPLTGINYYASIFPLNTLIGPTPPLGSTWVSNPLISRKYDVFDASPLTATYLNEDDGYIGVSFINGGLTHYGWIHYQLNNGGETVTILSAGSNNTAGSAVPAGHNDPYGPNTVPIPFIASFIAMSLIGVGSYFRKKRK